MHGTLATAELLKERVADGARAPIKLAHLAQLEAESIHIIREAVAESDIFTMYSTATSLSAPECIS